MMKFEALWVIRFYCRSVNYCLIQTSCGGKRNIYILYANADKIYEYAYKNLYIIYITSV